MTEKEEERGINGASSSEKMACRFRRFLQGCFRKVQGRGRPGQARPGGLTSPSGVTFALLVDGDGLRSALTRTLRCRQRLLPSEPEEHVTQTQPRVWGSGGSWVWLVGLDRRRRC